MSKNKKAFTLVELLVAMAIIGVLVGLAIFGISTAQRAQRDTERKTALQDIHLGIQSFYETHGVYPSTATFTESSITLGSGGTKTFVVELKGAGKSTGAPCNILATTSLTTSTRTCYAWDSEATGSTTGNNGITFCAKLENGSISCVGPGAIRGNVVNEFPSLGASGYVIP